MKPNGNHVEDAFRKARLVQPSPELRARVTTAARDAWQQRTPEGDAIPWPMPVLRLAACLVGVVVLAAAGNWVNGRSLELWRRTDVPPAAPEAPEFLAELDMPEFHACARLRPWARPALNAAQVGALLRARRELMRELMNGT